MALSQRQLEARRKGIGGSDANIIMSGDIKDWRALYTEKTTGVAPVFPADRQFLMDCGSAIEPVALAYYSQRTGQKMEILPPEHMVYWRVDPFFFFTPDARSIDGYYLQHKYHTGDKSITELVDYYNPQLQHEMLCSGTQRIRLVATFGHYGRQMHEDVIRDEKAIEEYLQRAMDFKVWITTGEMPAALAAAVELAKQPRKRDHEWVAGDNKVGPLCLEMLNNASAKTKFEAALKEMKNLVPRDAATATWRGLDGRGVKFKIASNGAVRWSEVFPQPK